MRYTSSSKKEPRHLKKNSSIFCRKTKASYFGPKSSLRPCRFSRKRMVSVSFISFEKYELRMRKKIRHFFPYLFCPKKPSVKKVLTSFLGPSVAYETLVQFTKPWTLCLVSVLRYRGSKIKKHGKIAFFQKLVSKPMKTNF